MKDTEVAEKFINGIVNSIQYELNDERKGKSNER